MLYRTIVTFFQELSLHILPIVRPGSKVTLGLPTHLSPHWRRVSIYPATNTVQLMEVEFTAGFWHLPEGSLLIPWWMRESRVAFSEDETCAPFNMLSERQRNTWVWVDFIQIDHLYGTCLVAGISYRPVIQVRSNFSAMSLWDCRISSTSPFTEPESHDIAVHVIQRPGPRAQFGETVLDKLRYF